MIYLDNAATTKLSDSMKEYLCSILDVFGNPSSAHSEGLKAKKIVEDARKSVAKFINVKSENILFTPSASASISLAIKGLVSDNPEENKYEVFYSPTSHKSMLKSCESCRLNMPLKVDGDGEIDLIYLDDILTRHNCWQPLVCVEVANSEIGTINDIITIGSIVHKHNGILVADATGYIPSYQVDMKLWKEYVDILIFSGHKIGALKGIGILWKKSDIELKPLIYGTQEYGLLSGTSNVLGIVSLGKACEDYNYSSISPSNRNYVYDYIVKNISDNYLIGNPINSDNRLPNNLYMCFQKCEAESLMILLDMNGICVSVGSACSSGDLTPSSTLSAIGINENDIHSCIRMTFGGNETIEELNYVCKTLKQCVETLRSFNTQ